MRVEHPRRSHVTRWDVSLSGGRRTLINTAQAAPAVLRSSRGERLNRLNVSRWDVSLSGDKKTLINTVQARVAPPQAVQVKGRIAPVATRKSRNNTCGVFFLRTFSFAPRVSKEKVGACATCGAAKAPAARQSSRGHLRAPEALSSSRGERLNRSYVSRWDVGFKIVGRGFISRRFFD